MEFLRKTLLGLVLVIGGLFTMHSLGDQAIQAFAPNRTLSSPSTEDVPADTVVARKPVLGFAEVPRAVTKPTPVAADRESLDAKSNTVMAAGEPENAPEAEETISPSAARSVWGGLWSEVLSGLASLFAGDLAKLIAIVSAGAAVGAVTAYKAYPRIQRIKRSRRLKAAEKRRRLRMEDEQLFAEASSIPSDASLVPAEAAFRYSREI